ncbi:SlyX protein [Marivita hallyeonensis]|uniref:SlyX protein n=2 Tax=Marivita hallyeonensis TaxID=996342 RepID=A0A1M5NCI6_9RHOB|nr:SlyX protein [Marivita hallyeonensis]
MFRARNKRVPFLTYSPLAFRKPDAHLSRMDQTQLEERIAHLLRVTDDLSDTVAAQAKEIDRLTARVEMLLQREAAREAEGSGGIVLGDERPPHY